MKSKIKAIILVSGGLDSTIVTHMMKEQGLDLLCVHFSSPFCTCNSGCGNKNFAKETADKLDLKFKIQFMGEDFLKIVANPKHGYGKNMNPCIDCRIYKFKKAKEIMEKEGAKFIITGEVVGQRPMSQYKRVMRLIEKESDLEGLVLRPLTSGLLNPTLPEKNNWVDSKKLLSINGRSRKEQLKIAEKYNLSAEDYACPAGGCRLTYKEYSSKIQDLIKFKKGLSLRDVNYLSKGRHFRISEKFKVIVGRNKEENEILNRMANHGEVKLWAKDYNGPLCLGLGNFDDNVLELMGKICGYYIKCEDSSPIGFIYDIDGKQNSFELVYNYEKYKEILTYRL
ncbi:asparagine synthase-related protein [Elusimicrobiota bacterium]